MAARRPESRGSVTETSFMGLNGDRSQEIRKTSLIPINDNNPVNSKSNYVLLHSCKYF